MSTGVARMLAPYHPLHLYTSSQLDKTTAGTPRSVLKFGIFMLTTDVPRDVLFLVEALITW